MTENLDAMRGVEHIDIDDREMFKAVLSATLVKHHRHQKAFDTVFDVYFSLFSAACRRRRRRARRSDEVELAGRADAQARRRRHADVARGARRRCCSNALQSMDRDALRRLAAAAVQQFAGMEPGRPVGGTYYLYRTLRQLDLDDLQARLDGPGPRATASRRGRARRPARRTRSTRRASRSCAS